ncbi:hypothetical protein A4R26_14825 [Niastella populi]|uniref:Uncharacterized protein n=1 Tax=Niastella populi TaxID=550983 RepID=A0A1V9G533_9BACT|nr:hypothetical protein A4R26_14825 [Niastella populi]
MFYTPIGKIAQLSAKTTQLSGNWRGRQLNFFLVKLKNSSSSSDNGSFLKAVHSGVIPLL